MSKRSDIPFCCPCCGTPLPDRPDPHKLVDHLPIGGVRRAVLRTLAANFGREVPRVVIEDRVYAGVLDGGPLSADSVIRQTVFQLNKIIKPYGLAARGTRYGTYRLDWIDAPALEPAE